MNRMKIAALLLGCAMSTAASGEARKDAEAAAKAAPDDVICTYESSVGSHMKRRVCTTRAARDEQSRADQNEMNRLRTNRTSGGKGGTQ